MHTPASASTTAATNTPREQSMGSRMAGQLTPASSSSSSSQVSASQPGGSSQQIPRMSDSLVTSLVAQSLDLPPRAARWRHQQRSGGAPRPPPSASQRIYDLPSVSEVGTDEANGNGNDDEGVQQQGGAHSNKARKPRLPLASLLLGGGAEDEEEGEGGKGNGRDLRSRVSGMLDRERGFR